MKLYIKSSEYDDMYFEQWVISDAGEQACDEYLDSLTALLEQKGCTNIWTEPSIQGYQGYDTIYFDYQGHTYSCDTDWRQLNEDIRYWGGKAVANKQANIYFETGLENGPLPEDDGQLY